MKPIETVYQGYRFRSRLEARWAVFFDSLGIEWRYEVERYGNEQYTYLPDFYLPRTKTWVEVKGDPGALQEDWQRMVGLLDFNSVLPDFRESEGSNRGLLLLGDIPDVSAFHGVVVHPLIQHHEGLVRNWAFFATGGPFIADFGRMARLFGLQSDNNLDGPHAGWKVESRLVEALYAWPQALEAYRAARAARFEHGQSGRPR